VPDSGADLQQAGGAGGMEGVPVLLIGKPRWLNTTTLIIIIIIMENVVEIMLFVKPIQ
jgi:hypothetical protein